MKEKTEDYLVFSKNLSKNATNIVHISNDLKRLAESFEDIGNEKMSNILFDYGCELYSIQEDIRNSHGEEVNREWKQSQANTKEMMVGILSLALDGKLNLEK